MDFGAVRDGVHPDKLGTRVVLNAPEGQHLETDEAND